MSKCENEKMKERNIYQELRASNKLQCLQSLANHFITSGIDKL